ncbi:hypothetical protein NFI96_033764 [Prochilodus magdalenae]|nr:hypothetical protein NFI96_033764 [Prochilodus magdalenae]
MCLYAQMQWSFHITVAMKGQPRLELMDCVQVYCVGAALLAVGLLFVISSFLALGFTGTFLGAWLIFPSRSPSCVVHHHPITPIQAGHSERSL